MTSAADLYRYRAVVVPWVERGPTGWHDGDTFAADVDLGVRVHWLGRVRCAGYDAPEVTGSTRLAGLVSRAYANTLVPLGAVVFLNSLAFEGSAGLDSFGRILAHVTLADGRDLAAAMVEAGQGVPR